MCRGPQHRYWDTKINKVTSALPKKALCLDQQFLASFTAMDPSEKSIKTIEQGKCTCAHTPKTQVILATTLIWKPINKQQTYVKIPWSTRNTNG